MMQSELTGATGAAKASYMLRMHSRDGASRAIVPLLMVSAVMMTGCISVNAPEEPIVIELNINIRQEVIYRLAEDAGDTIEENADIF